MNRSSFLILSVIIFFAAPQWVLSAKQKTPAMMTPVDLLNLPTLSSSKVSPDGKRIIYLRSESDWEENKRVENLWLATLTSDAEKISEPRQLTLDSASKSNVQWSPDGKYISFISKRNDDKHKRLYLLPVAGGEAYSAIEHEANIKNYAWNNSSDEVIFLASEAKSKELKERLKSKDDMQAFEVAVGYRRLWRVSLPEQKITPITPSEFHVIRFAVSPDNEFIAFSKAPELRLDDRNDADIWTIPYQGGKQRRITNNNYSESSIQISPDSKKLLFISGVNEKGESYYDANVFVVTLSNGRIQGIGLDHTFEAENAAWSASGDEIYVRANFGVSSHLISMNVSDSSFTRLTDGETVLRSWSYDRLSDSHAFTLRSAKNPGEVWHLPMSRPLLNQVTNVHGELTTRYNIPEQKLITWKGKDGYELEGLLTLPLNYKKGRRYPLVTYIHGGPKSSDQYGQFGWRSLIPVYAANGYAYFTPNHRGGRGYGDAFMRDMVGGYFTNAQHDVLSGIDHLVDIGVADPDQLAVTGWSAGGHMVNKLITITDRFKAASSGAGAVDWVSMYGESDVRQGRTAWFGGTPWQKDAPLDVYREHSPLKDMWRVKTPTIIFVGEKDVRVPPTQSKLLHRALRDNGATSSLYIAPREPHGFKELRHRLFKINAELDWFERYVRNRKYQWQAVPEN